MNKSLKPKTDDRVLISGKALLSTMHTLSTMGKIGRNVLKQYGIENIDEKAHYSYRIRNEIHKAARDRYGEVALTAIGFSHGEYVSKFDEVERVYHEVRDNFKSPKDVHKYSGLEKLFLAWVTEGDKLIKAVNKSNSYNFFQTCEKLSNNSFKVKSYSSWDDYQSGFYAGVCEYLMCKFFSRYWKYKITQNHGENKNINGFCVISITFEFQPFLSELTNEEFLKKRVNQIKDQLLQNVLDESDNKNNQLEEISHQIGKYIPPQIHEAIFSGKYDTQIKTRRKKLTIFFSDIANFTSTSEGLQPEDLTKYLNEYFSEMTTLAVDCGATIDKYIGDAMMVFFGDPESNGEREDARAGVEMALKMQERMEELQVKWSNEGFADPFQVRMGINTGYCNVGNFGSDQRLTYTIIGGEVNIAQRLESSADANGILLSYETYAHAQDMIEVQERETIKMKGISREIKVFSVIERKNNTGGKKGQSKKKPTKRELSDFDKMKKDMTVMKNKIEDLSKNMQILLKKL